MPPGGSRSRRGRLLCGSQLARLWLALALVLLAAPGCSSERRSPNLLLIVVDSLRADRLGCYGVKRPTSPSIDALAERGIVFERAYSSASWTQPSVASILTGRFASGHGLQRVGQGLPDAWPTLSDALLAEGYATGAVVSHLLIGERFGFARGFERFDESEARGHSHLSTDGVTRKATALLEELAAEGRPFFLFVHYFDPHYSYMRHPDIAFADPGEGRVQGGETLNQVVALLPSLSRPELRALRSLYDEEIRYTDDGIGQLIAALDRLELGGDTLVVFAADHGEEFIDHGFVGHTLTLYDEVVRVPLVVRLPADHRAGSRVTLPVSTVALAPTLLELMGRSDALLEEQAGSFADLVLGGEREATPLLMEVDYIDWDRSLAAEALRARRVTQKRAVVEGDWKLIVDYQEGTSELYELAADPREQHDLASERPREVRRLQSLLESEVLRVAGDAGQMTVEISEEEAAGLRALGYAAP